ncbi:cytochrome c [Yoonia sp.]|uniref:c-type cytochrome n=1 Tax=Yoonia sp. TaxID=2212373 RepID=UPI001A0C9B1C|nr:cytochrome c [Yoonia sp.]MBE0412706.1 cytochrome c [Yoonia sp.]
MNKAIAIAAVVIAAGIGGWFVIDSDTPTDTPLVGVVVPATFSDRAMIGQRAYDANCAQCHGANAAGQDGAAPPLVHKIYEPSHHGDESFQRAVAQGVRGHHWPFGDMAPVAGLSRADVAMIVAYVRELQRANGIN